MLSIQDPTEPLPGLDYFEAREQEVQAHVGSVYYEGLAEPILLSQDLSGGCGGKIWESANVMIEYLIWKNQHMEGKLFQDQTLVEIGAGTGLVGLAVAKVCPQLRHLVITDQIPMMQLMQENININQQAHLVSGEILNWGESIPQDSRLLHADVILVSDCIYLEVTFIPLFETLLALTTKPDTIIYLAYRKRRKADKRFFQMAKKKFVFTQVQDHPKQAFYLKQSLYLFIVRRK